MTFLNFNHFYSIGHRGNETEDPENTLSAFKRCIDYGIDIAELDVQLSKDGVPIIFHDSSISKKTGKKGKISDYLFSELAQIDVINNKTGTKDKIISLETLFQLIKNNNLLLQIELKAKKTASPTIDLIRKYQLEKKVYLSSFFRSELRTAHHYAPEISKILLVKSRDRYPWLFTESMFCRNIDNILKRLGCFGLSIHVSTLKESILHYFKTKGYFIVVWGVKRIEEYNKLVQAKDLFNGFSAPDIKYLKELLKN